MFWIWRSVWKEICSWVRKLFYCTSMGSLSMGYCGLTVSHNNSLVSEAGIWLLFENNWSQNTVWPREVVGGEKKKNLRKQCWMMKKMNGDARSPSVKLQRRMPQCVQCSGRWCVKYISLLCPALRKSPPQGWWRVTAPFELPHLCMSLIFPSLLSWLFSPVRNVMSKYACEKNHVCFHRVYALYMCTEPVYVTD